MVIIHSEKVNAYWCSKCPTTCNTIDNIRRHVRKHSGQTNTPMTVMYEIKEMTPEPVMPRRPIPMPKKTALSTWPYFNESMSTNDYIYQQTLKTKQTPKTWRLIPIDSISTKKPIRWPKDLLPIPYNPRLDLQTLQDLEEMNRQLLAELDVSNLDSSPDSTPTQDQTYLQDHLEDWMIQDKMGAAPWNIDFLKNKNPNLFRNLIQIERWLSEPLTSIDIDSFCLDTLVTK